MKNPKDNAGIHIPPPLFYLIFFAVGMILQKFIDIQSHFFKTSTSQIIGIFFLIAAILLLLSAIFTFLKNKTTMLPMKPASALQTKGIYSITRNPMYLGLLCTYIGSTFLFGNFWMLILLPFLIFTFQKYIISKEEAYLHRAFGEQYKMYQSKVRRWI